MCGSRMIPSGGHGGGRGAIGGKIALQPPPHVFFNNTARPEGRQISGMWQELEDKKLECLKSSEEEPFQRQLVYGCRSRWSKSRTSAASVPKVPTWSDGETSEKTRVAGAHPNKGNS